MNINNGRYFDKKESDLKFLKNKHKKKIILQKIYKKIK